MQKLYMDFKNLFAPKSTQILVPFFTTSSKYPHVLVGKGERFLRFSLSETIKQSLSLIFPNLYFSKIRNM